MQTADPCRRRDRFTLRRTLPLDGGFELLDPRFHFRHAA
jgi:hypothetical protein